MEKGDTPSFFSQRTFLIGQWLQIVERSIFKPLIVAAAGTIFPGHLPLVYTPETMAGSFELGGSHS